jgi:cytochrome c5
MKKSLFAGFAFIVVLMVLISACSSGGSSPTTAAMTDTEMKALIDERCSPCHSVSIVYNSSYSQSQWSTVFDQMIARGANVSADEKTIMIDWLVANQ